MIIIRTDSFWYKLMTFPPSFSYDRPKTLCSFFWKTFFNVFMWFMVVPCLVGFIGLVVVLYPINTLCLFLGLGLVFGGLYWYERKPKKEKKPDGIFISYVKAVKSKICPLIGYENAKLDKYFNR